MYFQLLSFCLHSVDSQSLDKSSLQTLFKLRNAQLTHPPRRFLRIVYFREFDMAIDEHLLKSDAKNLTESHGIDFKLNILDQSKSFSMNQLCTLLAQERRDTILVADLYTKEIDLLSRSLKIPTIAITNRYQVVQGKLVSIDVHQFTQRRVSLCHYLSRGEDELSVSHAHNKSIPILF